MEQPTQQEGVLVPRLTLAYLGQRVIVGVRKKHRDTEPGTLELEGAMELHIAMDLRHGNAAHRVAISPIFPFSNPVDTTVFASMCFDVSEARDLATTYNTFTGRSRVLLPGTSL
jgi:hypothetical protein